MDNFTPQVYNPFPGNPTTAGQVATSDTIRRNVGRPADHLVMEDSSDEARIAAGVRVGSLTIVKSAGYRSNIAEAISDDGQTLRGDGALWAVFVALQQEAKRS